MEKDFIFILQSFSRGKWCDKFSDKDLVKLSDMADSLFRITLERWRIIRLDYETVRTYGDEQ